MTDKKIFYGSLGIAAVIAAIVIAGSWFVPLGGEITLTEVPIVKTHTGQIYIHRFMDLKTKEIFEIETTEAEYKALALKGAGQPTYPNAKWIQSYENGIFATSTPSLKNNEYFVMEGKSGTSTTTGQGRILIKVNGKEKIIDANFIIDNKLTEAGLAELSK